ncbi:MAG: Uma2 family endonuclease [Acidobacteria bacterium]|nr:Uma2 family endonuclease [Acidobacteriota bacterium]
MGTRAPATVEDLYAIPDHQKAEIVNGELVLMSPTGGRPGRAAGEIYVSLRQYERRTKSGYAIPDNVGFIVNLPNRKSFSPDAAFFVGEAPGMRFIEGAPVFAVEVRSEGDREPRAESARAAKRADYFAAGTLIVWDVDLLGEEVIKAFHAPNSAGPGYVFRRGDSATAEPALPGWVFPVDALFA